MEYEIKLIKNNNNNIMMINGNHNVLKLIDQTLSFNLKEFNGSTYTNKTVKFLNDKNKFPIGLTDYITEIFSENGICYNSDFTNYNKLEIDNKTLNKIKEKARPYQAHVVRKAINFKRGIINIATGGGKTFIQYKLIESLCELLNNNKKSITILSSKQSVNQTIKRFKEYGLNSVGDMKSNAQHRCCGIKTALKYFENGKLDDIFLINIDECHKVRTALSYKKFLLNIKSSHVYGFSGTPFFDTNNPYSNYEDTVLISLIGKLIVSVSRTFLVKKGFIRDIKVLIKQIPRLKVNKIRSSSNYNEIYEKLLQNNDDRNKIIIDIAKKLVYDGYKLLIIVKRIAHGQKLLTLLHHAGLEHIEFVYGNNKSKIVDNLGRIINIDTKNLSERIANDLNIIIGSQIYGESFDAPELDALMNAAGGITFTGIKQRAGRLMRLSSDKKDPIFIDFDDSQNHRILKSHIEKRIEFYKQENITIEKWR